MEDRCFLKKIGFDFLLDKRRVSGKFGRTCSSDVEMHKEQTNFRLYILDILYITTLSTVKFSIFLLVKSKFQNRNLLCLDE